VTEWCDAAAALETVETLVNAAPVVIRHPETGFVDDEATYLAFHRRRFFETLIRVARTVPRRARVLDLGGQFLHAAMALHELDYVVDAADIAPYAEDPRLVARAREGLALHRIRSLAQLDFPDATYDAVLLLEILEHLAQNPRPMWVELARVLKPSGRVIVTTPNLYRVGGGGGAALQLGRLLTGRGAGPTIAEVLALQTGAHHWKEYGRRELRQYFFTLGWDIARSDSFNYLPSRHWWLLQLKRWLPPLQDCLYLELTRA